MVIIGFKANSSKLYPFFITGQHGKICN